MKTIKTLARKAVSLFVGERVVPTEAKYLSLAIWSSNLTSFHRRLRF